MKYETKLKIIRLVEKLLKMEPVAQPLIIREERKLEVMRYQHIYQKEELDWLKSHNALEMAIAQHIMIGIKEAKAIKITEKPDVNYMEERRVIVSAELIYIIP